MLTQQLRSNTAMDHQNTCCTDLLSSTTTARTTTATAKLPLKRKKGPTRIPRYKKAPGAPKRFKSAFIFFSTWKHKEIRKQLGKGNATESTTTIAKHVSEAWKGLSDTEREVWNEKARVDKRRYEIEKSMYKGPWKVLSRGTNPNAPKRPMSAFLAFSNSKRGTIKAIHPDASNADISRILSEMWKDAGQDVKQQYVEEEFQRREQYKVNMAQWRTLEHKAALEARQEREQLALFAAQLQQQQPGLQLPLLPATNQGSIGGADLVNSGFVQSFSTQRESPLNLAPQLSCGMNDPRLEEGSHTSSKDAVVGEVWASRVSDGEVPAMTAPDLSTVLAHAAFYSATTTAIATTTTTSMDVAVNRQQEYQPAQPSMPLPPFASQHVTDSRTRENYEACLGLGREQANDGFVGTEEVDGSIPTNHLEDLTAGEGAVMNDFSCVEDFADEIFDD